MEGVGSRGGGGALPDSKVLAASSAPTVASGNLPLRREVTYTKHNGVHTLSDRWVWLH